MNHATDPVDVLEVLEWLEQAPIPEPNVDAVPPAALPEREPGVWVPWMAESQTHVQTVRAIPMFGSLTDEQAETLAEGARLVSVEPGQEVVRQWEGSRDLFVVLDGSAQVSVETSVVRELGPGDVFGEVAALEWGLEFGYARTATVSAISPMRVLVVPRDALHKLLPEAPMLGDELRRLSQQHLAGH